jgi:hypothetical protein
MTRLEEKLAARRKQIEEAPRWRKMLWWLRRQPWHMRWCQPSLTEVFVERILRVRWVVNDLGELGVVVCGIHMIYYKRPSPLIYGRERRWRDVAHREFGETIRSEYAFEPDARDGSYHKTRP